MKSMDTNILEAYADEPQEIKKIISKISSLSHKKTRLANSGQDTSSVTAEMQKLKAELADLKGKPKGALGRGMSAGAAGKQPAAAPGVNPNLPKSKEYQNGYNAALQMIKKLLDKNSSPLEDGNTQGNNLPIAAEVIKQGIKNGSKAAKDLSTRLKNQKNPESPRQNSNGAPPNTPGAAQTSPAQAGSMVNDLGKNENGKSEGRVNAANIPANTESTPRTQAAGEILDKNIGNKLRQANGHSPHESDSLDSLTKSRAESLLNAIKSNGKYAGSSDKWSEFCGIITDLYRVAVDWKKALKALVSTCINPLKQRQAYTNKNLLVAQDRFARTGKDQYDSMDYIVCGIDCSGSVDNNVILKCLKEIYQIATQKNPLKLYILYFNTKVIKTFEFKNKRELELFIRKPVYVSGGGTDPKCVFDYLKEQKLSKHKKAQLCVIFSDGYFPNGCHGHGCPQRDISTMEWLVWAIFDDSSFELKNNHDRRTKVVLFKTDDIK